MLGVRDWLTASVVNLQARRLSLNGRAKSLFTGSHSHRRLWGKWVVVRKRPLPANFHGGLTIGG